MSLTHERPMCFVPTASPDRARAFYEGVLGLRLEGDEPWALVFDAAGTMLCVQKTQGFTPHPFTAMGWRVGDIAATVRALGERGVVFERFPFMQQDGAAIWDAPGGTRVAWFRDPEGNLLSLTQFA